MVEVVEITNVSDVDCAYLAGLIDGEGSLTIAWMRRKKGIQPDPRVAITFKKDQKELEVLLWIKDRFGGKVYVSKKIVKWEVYSLDDIEKILTNIHRFLRLKKRQCEILLQVIKLVKSDNEKHLLGFRRETILEIAKLYDELLKLHKKTAKSRLKWTYEKIVEFVNNNPIYDEEYRKRKLEKFMKAGEKTRFKKGMKLPPDIIEKRNVRIRKAVMKYPDEVVRKAKQLYMKGYKPSEIARILNVNKNTLKTWLYGFKRKYVTVR